MNSSNYTTTVNNVTWHELAYDIETLENIYKDFTIQSNTKQKIKRKIAKSEQLFVAKNR